MYGRLYYKEKLKPLVDKAHDAALAEFNSKPAEGNEGGPPQMPKRVLSWAAVAKEEYARESVNVKRRVQDALEEHIREINLLNEPVLGIMDEDIRLARLDA